MSFSRRAFLATAGSAVATGFAGCSGNSSSYECDTEDPDTVSSMSHPIAGDSDADVTVAVFEDFGSPACAEWKLEQFPTIEEKYIETETIRYEHWDFPIPASRWSESVANAARGIQDRHDDETFFLFARAAYERQADHSEDVIGSIAEDIGADPCAAIADAQSEPYDDVLMNDRGDAVDDGIESAPIAVVEGEQMYATAENVTEAIERHR